MRNCLFIFFVGLLISLSSCRKDFDFEPSTGDLRFSKDTVYLDTVFTDIGSSTYTLKVYNKSDKDIEIPTIKLGKGLDSKYRMTVDGMTGEQGKIFNNVELLANDSLYIYIETTANIADANPTDFLYTDQIQFDTGSNLQTVELVTLIQDAVFLYPQKFDNGTTETLPVGDDQIYGFYLDHNDPIHGDEYHFTSEKPYVIYGYAGVASGQTLVIDQGAHVHFHDGSGILVGNGGAIQVGGTDPNPANEVVFEGDRLEPDFSDIPGQWGTIWLSPGTAASSFNHVTIKNAIIGLYIQNNPAGVTIQNTQIYDCSNYGILAQTGHITGENMVINSAGQATLACTYGGNYNFKYSTFNNNWPSSGQVAVLVGDYVEGANPETQPLTEATFDNCIIHGSNQIEMFLDKHGPDFNYRFNHCLIKFNNIGNDFATNPLYNFTSDTPHYDTCYIATSSSLFKPHFWDVNKNKLNIDEESEAIGKADPSLVIPFDILNVARTSLDLGAYQHAPVPEEN